jgi:hypothetical protein
MSNISIGLASLPIPQLASAWNATIARKVKRFSPSVVFCK